MNCKTCIVRGFVHAEFYCQRCKDKPKSVMKSGRAYLFRKNTFNPVLSIEIEAPEGREYEIAAFQLMREFRIEFIESEQETF